MELAESGKLLVFAEQNNGYLLQSFLKTLYRCRTKTKLDILERVVSISTLDQQGKPQFIHAATYEQLRTAFGLSPEAIADIVEKSIAERR